MLKPILGVGVIAALMVPPLPVKAAQFDGTWVVDFPPVTVSQKRSGCMEMRVVAVVKENQISATLERDSLNPREVKNGTEPEAEPLTGTVAADGTFTARWENFSISGKLSSGGGDAQVQSSCGPRTGTIVRVEAQMEH